MAQASAAKKNNNCNKTSIESLTSHICIITAHCSLKKHKPAQIQRRTTPKSTSIYSLITLPLFMHEEEAK